MLDKVNLDARLPDEAYRDEIKALRKRLSVLQFEVKDNALPVIIIFEGWSAAGKGKKMSELLKTLDPRYFTSYSITPPSADEMRKHFLWRHWLNIPPKGRIAIYDRSWYPEAVIDLVEKRISGEEAQRRLDSIVRFERQLADDGVLIVKFFLHISKDEQKKRLDELAANSDTAWRVVTADYRRNQNYIDFYDAYNWMIAKTGAGRAPWRLISGHDSNYAVTSILKELIAAIESALKIKSHGAAATGTAVNGAAKAAADGEANMAAESGAANAAADGANTGRDAPLLKMKRLKDADLTLALGADEYKKRLAEAQSRLFSLHNALFIKKVPLIIAYEGWDAAGKGGNIKRLTEALDPRGYNVVPIAAPDSAALSRPFLWRFWLTLPKDGHIAIYDRSWYGRVLVERIEGFARSSEWKRAYREINEFEQDLADWGAIIVKFWMHIDRDEQLKRFTKRTETPEKHWKIDPEDWRNRDKWDEYEPAVDEMLRRTSTSHAPWHIIESQDKRFARIKTLDILIAALEKRLY